MTEIFDEILPLLTGVLVAALGTILSYFLKNKIDLKTALKEETEIKAEVTRFVNIIDKGEKDVLALMMKNVAELREYYVINKQQARNSYSAALIMSILGFLLFAGGVIISYVYNGSNIIQYSTIGGAIVETIAGLFFWLYSKAITQINIFHSSLLKTEKFLTAIQLVEKISPENRDKTYSFIISKIITLDGSSEVIIAEQHKKSNNKENKD